MSDAKPTNLLNALPKSFLDFLAKNGVNPKVYEQANGLPRFFRVNPRNSISLEELLKQFARTSNGPCTVKPTKLDGLYEIASDVKIVEVPAYKLGQIYGIDLSSAVTVLALDPQPDDHVLDLCAAPGAKLCMIADRIVGKGSVTGVDISENRLNIAKSLVRKYEVKNARLFLQDGTTFCVPAPTPDEFDKTQVHMSCLKKKQKKVRRRKTEARRMKKKRKLDNQSCQKEEPTPNEGQEEKTSDAPSRRNAHVLYDKVLVDAECTHDGSPKHIMKYFDRGWDEFEKNVLDPVRLKSLQKLQRDLLCNGFKMLKPGGSLVYSTCSFCESQNEDIVSWFISQTPNARIISIDADICTKSVCGKVEKTVRFDPITSRTKGMFIAKIVKLSS